MNKSAVHNIQVSHEWSESHRTIGENGATIIHELCRQCGQTRTVHDLTTIHDRGFDEASPAEMAAYWRDFKDMINKGLKALGAMWDGLLDGTQFSSTDDLAAHLGKRYQGVVDGNRLPFSQLEEWTETPSRKQQLKILLVHQQGQVCNRCDNIFSSRLLTIDHIDHNRSNAKLTNLQLLCEQCAGEKADKSPGPNDISPFAYEGEACLHPLTCVELNRLIEAEKEQMVR